MTKTNIVRILSGLGCAVIVAGIVGVATTKSAKEEEQPKKLTVCEMALQDNSHTENPANVISYVAADSNTHSWDYVYYQLDLPEDCNKLLFVYNEGKEAVESTKTTKGYITSPQGEVDPEFKTMSTDAFAYEYDGKAYFIRSMEPYDCQKIFSVKGEDITLIWENTEK